MNQLNTALKLQTVLFVGLSTCFVINGSPCFAKTGNGYKHEVEFEAPTPPTLAPAKRYSGSTPIDLSNGVLYNNGTYGLPNAEYEEWSKTLLAVGISDKNYPFAVKERFTSAYEERLAFFDAALYNWKQKSDITKPEAIEYAKQATEAITPRLQQAKDALHAALSAGQDQWESAQSNARHALVELQATYYTLHHNPAPVVRR